MKLTIITVNLNNKLGLEKTILSVINQSFTDFEYILIDGGSSDGSCDLISKYSSSIDIGLSEHDNGIYNAMNKGINLASGDYIYFLNSGDTLYSNNVLLNLSKYFNGVDFLFGSIKRNYRNGSIVEKIPSQLSFSYIVRYGINHQATFTKKTVFVKEGLYDEKLKITSDFKLLLNAIAKNNSSYRVTDEIISIYDQYGISAVNRMALQEEKEKIINSDYSIYIPDLKYIRRIDYITFIGICKKINYYYCQLFLK